MDSGVAVKESWKSFSGFIADMGYMPTESSTLVRRGKRKMEPLSESNCKWALPKSIVLPSVSYSG